jgi:hypothetical protein
LVWVAPANCVQNDLAPELTALEDAYDKAIQDWFAKYKANARIRARQVAGGARPHPERLLRQVRGLRAARARQARGREGPDLGVCAFASQEDGDEAKAKGKAAFDAL